MWAIAPLASGLRCAWPGRGQPWTSAAWPPWVWREDGWTGPTMSERRTAGNRLCLKTQCGEAASLGEPRGSAEKRDHGLFWEEEQGLPSPSTGMQHRLHGDRDQDTLSLGLGPHSQLLACTAALPGCPPPLPACWAPQSRRHLPPHLVGNMKVPIFWPLVCPEPITPSWTGGMPASSFQATQHRVIQAKSFG